jgi:hypothetical protein
MMPSWCRQVNWENCGIPWMNCAVLCVKDDWKGQFWGLRYCLSKLRSSLSFPSGMTSHSKIAQFNWKCIAPLTAELTRQGLRSVLYFTSVFLLHFRTTLSYGHFSPCYVYGTIQVRGSAAGWGTALQAKMTRVRFPRCHWNFSLT